MSVAELQKKIIDKISKTTDADLLEDIYNFIDTDQTVAGFYELCDSQLATIQQSQQQIKEGRYFTNNEVNKEINEWLEK